MRKNVRIILIIAAVVVALAIAAYFYLSSQGYIGSLNFNFGTNPGDTIGTGTDANVFDNTKLNPFAK